MKKRSNSNCLMVDEVAAKMRVNRRTVQTWIDSGKLIAVDARPEGAQRAMWRIEPIELTNFIKRRKRKREEL